jgi:hypothetical protein
MEMGVEIHPVPEGLDGGDDPGRKRASGHNLEVTAQGPEGATAEIAQETTRCFGGSGLMFNQFQD